MKLLFIHFLIILNLLFSLELIPSTSHVDWEILQEDDHIWIGWTDYGGFQWCKAKITIQAPLEDISIIIEDKTDPEKNVSHEYKTTQIFKASDMMVDSLTNLLAKERSKKDN